MNKIRKIQYDCHRATYLIEKRQEVRLTVRERMELIIHLAGCSVCRVYRKQSAAISAALKEIFGRATPTIHLDQDSKRSMQEKIDERMRG